MKNIKNKILAVTNIFLNHVFHVYKIFMGEIVSIAYNHIFIFIKNR